MNESRTKKYRQSGTNHSAMYLVEVEPATLVCSNILFLPQIAKLISELKPTLLQLQNMKEGKMGNTSETKQEVGKRSRASAGKSEALLRPKWRGGRVIWPERIAFYLIGVQRWRNSLNRRRSKPMT